MPSDRLCPQPRQRPTRRQIQVLRAYVAAGSIAAAAYELGISETTTRQHLSGLYRRTGCLNATQAAYLLGARQLDSDATPHRRIECGDDPTEGDVHAHDRGRDDAGEILISGRGLHASQTTGSARVIRPGGRGLAGR